MELAAGSYSDKSDKIIRHVAGIAHYIYLIEITCRVGSKYRYPGGGQSSEHWRAEESGIALEQMVFIGDAIFPGANDYPVKEAGVKTVLVRDPDDTLKAIAAIIACLQ